MSYIHKYLTGTLYIYNKNMKKYCLILMNAFCPAKETNKLMLKY